MIALVTIPVTKVSFPPSTFVHVTAGESNNNPEEPKKEEAEKKEGEEEKKEGDAEGKVEEVEEPDDTPVDLSEFWVKPDQVRFPHEGFVKSILVLSSRASICWMRNMRRLKARQIFDKSLVSR